MAKINDMDPPVPNIAELVATIRTTPLGKVPGEQLTDVLEILEHIRKHTLAGFDRLAQAQGKLATDQQALSVAQSALTLRQRVQEAREATMALIPPTPKGKRWWRPW